ncbi:MAG: hypothetical protein RI988_1414, partial [Pseudomonadota bacterium]
MSGGEMGRRWDAVDRWVPVRYWALIGCVCLALTATAGAARTGLWLWWAMAAAWASLVALGVHDLLQSRHAILVNYPVIGHLRFLLELIRP